jgi:Holliday junction resolvase RusA-like endonuclease
VTTTADVGDEAACFRLFRELGKYQVVARFTIDGEPASKARARFTGYGYGKGGRAYTPEATRAAEDAVAWKFRQAAPGYKVDSEHTFGVMALFFADTRHRRDVDNMLKLILDGLNGIAWKDDAQVDEVAGRRGYDVEGNARTEVIVYRLTAIRRPTRECAHCGQKFQAYKSWADRRYCSDACVTAARQARNTRLCPHCGQQFVGRGPTTPKYCSPDCANAAERVTVQCGHCQTEMTIQRCHRKVTNYCSEACRDVGTRARRRSIRKGDCQTCGGPVSRKEYVQCRACRIAGTKVSGAVRLTITPTGAPT